METKSIINAVNHLINGNEIHQAANGLLHGFRKEAEDRFINLGPNCMDLQI